MLNMQQELTHLGLRGELWMRANVYELSAYASMTLPALQARAVAKIVPISQSLRLMSKEIKKLEMSHIMSKVTDLSSGSCISFYKVSTISDFYE